MLVFQKERCVIRHNWMKRVRILLSRESYFRHRTDLFSFRVQDVSTWPVHTLKRRIVMDPETIALAVAAFTAWSGESFAQEAGKAIFEKCGSLIAKIRDKLQKDEQDTAVLASFEADPSDLQQQKELEEIIAARITDDPTLAGLVTDLATLADSFDLQTRNLQLGGRSQHFYGKVEKSPIIQGDYHGDITIQ